MNFMVTGLPGCGKTTLVQRVVEQLGKSYDLATVATGFTTEEVRGPRGRIGFDVVALNGRKAPLSRSEETSTSWPPDQKMRPRVGRYLVDVASFESVALPELLLTPRVKLMVIDEIGKMEFYSEPFLDAVQKALDSQVVVFGVIPVIGRFHSGGNPLQVRGFSLVNEIHQRSDVQVVTVTKSNREGLVQTLTSTILPSLSSQE